VVEPSVDGARLCNDEVTAMCRARAQSVRLAMPLAVIVAALASHALERSASAQPPAPEAAAPEPAAPEPAAPGTAAPEPVIAAPRVPRVQIHGFASEGAFLSTANDYLGAASRASLELFEGGINFSTDVADRLRAGIQLFARDIGALRDEAPRIDWAYLDFRWRRWLGLRAGVIKMPFGLYNEYVDIDAARLPILLPESVYPVRNRDVLLSHTGFSVYGSRALDAGGELEYQAWLGTLTIAREALDLSGATLDSAQAKYVVGAQAFWHPPLVGLRVGATYLRASIDFRISLVPESTRALIMAGLVPSDFDGKLVISQRPDTLVVGSAEYTRGDWLVAAEYSRWFKRQRSTLPALLPTFEEDGERFYAMATTRLRPWLETGGYYSVFHVDAGDRGGRDPRFAERFHAFQRDLAATLRFDVNDHWLWKLEGHFMDGTASLPALSNPHPERYWGLFLLRTTVTF
jgi:hypothetical protein